MVNDRFIKLVTKELSDTLTAEEREELTLMLNIDQECRFQRETIRDYWKQNSGEYAANAAMFNKVLDKINANDITGENEYIVSNHDAIPKKRFFNKFWYSAAAILIIFIGFIAFRAVRSNNEKERVVALKWLQKTTRPAEREIIKLADGTVVTLNAATTFRFPETFSGKTREVYLDGEAFFDVHKDHQHPFIIHTNKMNVRVLGTVFNVRSYKNQPISETTLIRGSVEVTLHDRPSDRIILKPKEKLIVQNNISTKKPIKIDGQSSQEGLDKETRYSLTGLTYYNNNNKTIVETSWTQNKLVFSDKAFPELADQLDNWYGVHIRLGNDRVKSYRFSGLFEKESLAEALDALKMTESFNYRITDSTVYIY